MCGRSTSVLLRRAYMAGVGQAELGAFDNQERALAKILWRATWGHGMRMDRRPIDRSQRWLRRSKGRDRCREWK